MDYLDQQLCQRPTTGHLRLRRAGATSQLDLGETRRLPRALQQRPHVHTRNPGAVCDSRILSPSTCLDTSLASTQGSYEDVALLGLCHVWRHTQPSRLAALRSTLRYEATTLTTPTGLFGETWQRWLNGTITPFNDQPHVWEEALFDQSAICLDGSVPYFSGGTSR